ncbi:hypothetical protein KAU33_02585 [Candidatus Dependentiae bacterium]|nr:hypothetical protein [Candidatus Dependentiae bacterium]
MISDKELDLKLKDEIKAITDEIDEIKEQQAAFRREFYRKDNQYDIMILTKKRLKLVNERKYRGIIMNLTDINPTEKLFKMSEAAAPFFKDIGFKEGDFFGGTIHTCNNETFWKDALPGNKNWKLIMLAGAGGKVCGITKNTVDSPNQILACGHRELENLFHIFKPCELMRMLHGSSEGYFNEKWNADEPLKMMLKIVTHSSESFESYFYGLKSLEEFMLAFYMLEVHFRLWHVPGGKWIERNES